MVVGSKEHSKQSLAQDFLSLREALLLNYISFQNDLRNLHISQVVKRLNRRENR